MTLDDYLERRKRTCTHVIVIHRGWGGTKPRFEAILEIHPEQLRELELAWTREYYKLQERASLEKKKICGEQNAIHNKERAAKRKSENNKSRIVLRSQ